MLSVQTELGRNAARDRVWRGTLPSRRRSIGRALAVLVLGACGPVSTRIAHAGIEALAIDPTVPTTLYAGTTYPPPPLRPTPDMPPIGVYKSTDGARTWSPTGLIDIDISSLAIDPTAPATLYAGTLGGGGVYKSIDGAGTWSQSGLYGAIIYRLVIDPTTTPPTIYAHGVSIVGVGFLSASTDGGATWNEIHTGGPSDAPVPTIAYSRGLGVYKTTDGGTTWLARSTGITDANVEVLAVDPMTPTTLYAGTAGAGLFKSTDGACSWSPAGLSHTVGPSGGLPVCQAGPDGVGIACRLDQLALIIRALHPNGASRFEASLAMRATAARDRVTEAETLASTDEREASTRLRRATRRVVALIRIDRPAMRASSIYRLIFSLTDGILTDLQALRRLGASQAACR